MGVNAKRAREREGRDRGPTGGIEAFELGGVFLGEPREEETNRLAWRLSPAHGPNDKLVHVEISTRWRGERQ